MLVLNEIMKSFPHLISGGTAKDPAQVLGEELHDANYAIPWHGD
jgi:hypothetical protein